MGNDVLGNGDKVEFEGRCGGGGAQRNDVWWEGLRQGNVMGEEAVLAVTVQCLIIVVYVV